MAGVSFLILSATACDGTVDPVPVAAVTLSPANGKAVVTQILPFDAAARDASGNRLPGRAVTWSSSDTLLATVSDSGVVTARGVGNVQITATAGGQTATTTITIVPVPSATQVGEFFYSFSWWGNSYKSPVATQKYDRSWCSNGPGAPCLDPATYRQQWNNLWHPNPIIDWIRSDPRNRGHLYTMGDDVNDAGFDYLYWFKPQLYAADYCKFVKAVQDVDPTSEFGTSMFHDNVTDAYLNAFADSVLSTYRAGNCGVNPISEWTFNVYGLWSHGVGTVTDYMAKKAALTMSYPAPIGKPVFVGAWVLGWRYRSDDVPDEDPRYVARIREAKALLFANPNIRGARYLLHEPWPVELSDPHPLTDMKGNLTATGRAYAEVTGRVKGPSAVRPGASCVWSAETTGGAAPYVYEWNVGGKLLSRREGVAFGSDSAFVVELRVTDGNGGWSVANRSVSVSATAPSC